MSDLVRYDPLEHGQLVGGLKKYRGLTQKEAREAADDTALTRGFNNSMRSARMAWNAFTGDKEELGQLKAEDMDYRKIQEGRKSEARRELGEAWDKGEGVGGGLSNVWGELKKDWREKGLDGVLEDVGEMGGATLEQAPNALVPLATSTVGRTVGAIGGAFVGGLAGGGVGAVPGAFVGGHVGGLAGYALGNTLMEYGEQLDRAAQAAGVDPTDKDAMMAFIDRGAPGALKNAAVKGAVVGAVDMATMKLGGSILNMGKKAAEKAALEKMGVAAADKAAVAAAKGTPEFAALAAKESAKGGLGGAARHTAAYALEPASEFAGEYLGTGLANGEWDEKGAALEAFSSLGHSAVEFVGTKAYAAMTDPLKLSAEQKADALADAKGNIEGNRKAGKLTPEEAQALRAAVEAALDGGVEQGGAGFDTAHHDQLYLTLQQFVDRTKQKEAEQFFSSPADSNTPHTEELAREMEKQPDVSGIPSEDEAEFLNTGVMSDGLARQYADMAAKYRAKPSEAMGINPDNGAISAAAALAVDSGAAVPSAVSDDVEAPSVADDVLSERSADADRGGVSSAYGNVRSGGAPRGAASVASGGSAAAASGGIARVAPLPAGQYFDSLDTRGRKALAKEAGFDIKGVADFGQIAEPVRQKIEEAYHARIEADYQAASEAKQGYLPPPVRMADAVPVPKKGFSVPADALNKESRRRFDALPEGVRRHAQTVADYTADGIMRQEAGMADMRGHYPEGLAESVRAVRAYRAEHPESADVLDRLNRAVYGYRRNNGWNVPLLSREGERLQGVRTALPDDGASEAVVGGSRGLPRALPMEDKGLAQDVQQDVRQGLTQGGRGLTPDAGADSNAAALQVAPEADVAPGLSASENLAETDGGKGAPVAGKRPDTVLPVLNPQVTESAVKVSPKKRMADAAADFTRRLAADRRKLEKAGVPLGDGEYRFAHTNRKHIDALAGVLDRLGKGGMLEEFADMAGSSHSDGLVFDGRRYLKGKEAETLQAGGLLEAVPSKSGWDYRLTQEGRALAKVMARSRDAAADGKSAGKAQAVKLATDELDAVRGDILFSLDESPDSAFARAVDEIAGGSRKGRGHYYLRMGTTPDVLKMLGFPDVKISIRENVIDKALFDKHSVLPEDLKQIPKQINSPVAVMKSDAGSSNPDGYLVLTELVEHERGTDKPVVAALDLKRTKDGLEIINITSVYGRRGVQVQRGLNNGLMYWDKEKGSQTVQAFGLQLPSKVAVNGVNRWDNVKTDSDLVQYLKAEKQGKFDKKQENAKQHAESIKKRLAESIGRLAEQVDVAAVSETAPDKAQMLLSERVEGWFDGRTGKITLVAENLTPERAVWVAWHELGHRGFAAEGFAKYREELERADGNSLIRRIADAVQEEREGTGDAAASVRSAAVEEAVVELYAAQRTGDWSGIENRYGVKVGNGLKRSIAGVLARIGAVLRRVLQRLTGKVDGTMSDADVFAMLADLHGNAEGARNASSDGVKPSRSAMKDTDANIRRGRAAMNRALVQKTSVHHAMYRQGLGWVDFVWGSEGKIKPNGKTKGGMGILHIFEGRTRKDGMGYEDVVRLLTEKVPETIAKGEITNRNEVNGSVALKVDYNGVRVALSKQKGSNAWMVTAFELNEGANGKGYDNTASTGIDPTLTRADTGASYVASGSRQTAETVLSDTQPHSRRGRGLVAERSNNVRAKDESVNTADGTRFSRAEERSKSESLEKLRRAETIRISGREIPEGGNLREYKRNALEYGKSLRGSYVNKDTGREITLGASGVKEVLQHDYKDAEHLQSIAAIPQIIENAVYIDTLPNEDSKVPHIKEFEYYLAGLNIGGTDYTVRAAVGVSDFGDRYYDHKLTKIEKGKLLEARHSDNKSGVPQQQNALGNFDDKRLLQILQDKDAGKGGIADFDTEAVRFSRAANIGAAISHITGKKSDLRNALKDRWDASKGIQLQFLGRRQIEDIYGGSLDGLKEYGRLSELFGADANKAVTEADKVVREWGRLKKEDAKALADLMHDATLAKVDADPLMRGDAQKRLDGIRTALDIADGKIEKAKAVIASANARIARADAAYDKASEAAKKAQSALLAAEEKAGREILADEADMRLRRLFYADSEAKRALRHAEADVMAESRAKTDAVQMLKQARADVRRLEKDEVEAQKALEGLALLNRHFAKLPDAAQRVYRKARDDYRVHFGQVRDAIAERLARAGQDAEIVRRLKERFDNELGGVYFPLARFGDYLVVVKDADGNNVNVSRAETLSEAEKLRDALKADFGAGFKVSPVMKSRDYIQSRDAVSGGFMKELGEAVGMLDLDPAQQAQLNDTLTQLYLNSLPDTSWAKHGIHRKGVPGFSDDARRAYAQNMGSGANYLAKLRYADRMAEQLDVMQDFVDGRKYEEGFNQRQLQRVADEMRKRHEAVMNPNPSKLAQALTGFGFLWMMGMSPASAIVNLSQTAMVAYPVMAAKWGYADAARELLRASKQIGLRIGEKFNTIEDSLNEDEKAAFQKAVDYGVIDLSQAHDLAGVANGDPGLAGSAWQKVMDKASWLFHHAEKFNRQVTFVAAYRLAKRAGADSDTAFEQAKKATYDGHFDYAAQNRPRFMMGNVAKVVFLFKQYSQNILYALGRNAYLAFKGDKEARKTLAGLLVSHAMASGILGLPFVSTLLAVASMLGSDDDDPWDAEAALRNMLADTFGDKAGEVMAKGFSRLTPLDVSGRLGLNQLIFPDIQDGLEGKKWAESLVVGSTGAVVGAGIGAADGVQKILDGRYMEGLESMLPVAIRNPLKAVRYATDGQVDKSGITVKDDFNLFELAGQAVGFRPSDLALKQEGKSAVYQRDRALSAARAKILSAMAKAVVEQDAAALRELRGVVAQWNRKHPERAIKSENIMAGVRNRQQRVAGAKDGIYLPEGRSDARTDGGFAFGH